MAKTFRLPLSGAGRRDDAEQHELRRCIMLGLQCAAGMAVFTFLGYWVDQKRGGGLFFTVCGMIIGLGYGAYLVWKVMRMLSAQAQAMMQKRAGEPETPGETPGRTPPHDQ